MPIPIKSSEQRKNTTVRRGEIGFEITWREVGLKGSQCYIGLEPENPKSTGDKIMKSYHPYGQVVEEAETLHIINSSITESAISPLIDIRMISPHILHDTFPHEESQVHSYQSKLPLRSVRIPTWFLRTYQRKGDTMERDIEFKEFALELLGDIPEACITTSDKVLSICRLGPFTRFKDLAIIFGQFGDVTSVEIVRDKKTVTLWGTVS